MRTKKLVRINCQVNSNTLWHLKRFARACNYGDNIGKAIDKLVREKCISLRIMQDEHF